MSVMPTHLRGGTAEKQPSRCAGPATPGLLSRIRRERAKYMVEQRRRSEWWTAGAQRASASQSESSNYEVLCGHSGRRVVPKERCEGNKSLESSSKPLPVSSLLQISSAAIRFRLCRFSSSKLLTATSASCSVARSRCCVLMGSLSKSTWLASRQTKSAPPNDQFKSISSASLVAWARSLVGPSPAPLLTSPKTKASAARPARHILSLASASLGVIVGNGAGSTCPPRAVIQALTGVGKGDSNAARRCPASWRDCCINPNKLKLGACRFHIRGRYP
ncbi:hypothetical protein SAMN04488039_10541 [Sulfitobacter dubius]|nr:hypothetical protein SAMN04488039_10541 [Sulfitobacter dubius]